jgi:DNA-directed RNA polymerase subunit RPC12/RpoP
MRVKCAECGKVVMGKLVDGQYFPLKHKDTYDRYCPGENLPGKAMGNRSTHGPKAAKIRSWSVRGKTNKKCPHCGHQKQGE